MNSPNHLQQETNDIVTFRLKSSTTSRLIARLIVTTSLVAVSSCFLSQTFAKEYEKGQALTQEKYLKDFDRHKQSLLRSGDYNAPLTIFVSLILISFVFGSYELLVLGIGLIIGKIIKS